MAGGQHDLSGTWDGTFAYPDVPEAGPVTPFLATITERSGVIEGTVIEPHEFSAETTAHAVIAGQRTGQAVSFAKTYHDAGEEYRETVLYRGSLCTEGEVITGEWSIDHWRGTFEMVRSTYPAPEAVDAEVEAV